MTAPHRLHEPTLVFPCGVENGGPLSEQLTIALDDDGADLRPPLLEQIANDAHAGRVDTPRRPGDIWTMPD